MGKYRIPKGQPGGGRYGTSPQISSDRYKGLEDSRVINPIAIDIFENKNFQRALKETIKTLAPRRKSKALTLKPVRVK